MHSRASEEGGATRIVIPNRPMHPLMVIVMFIPLAVPLWLVTPLDTFFRESQTPLPVAWVFLGMLIVAFAIVPALLFVSSYLRARRGATIVTVSAERLELATRGAWRTTTVASLAAADILDVDYSTKSSFAASARRAGEEAVVRAYGRSAENAVGVRTERWLTMLSRFVKGRGVTVKSRSGLHTFGQGLSDEEIRYLHWLVWERLAGR
jgi:hypothetical protein